KTATRFHRGVDGFKVPRAGGAQLRGSLVVCDGSVALACADGPIQSSQEARGQGMVPGGRLVDGLRAPSTGICDHFLRHWHSQLLYCWALPDQFTAESAENPLLRDLRVLCG